MKNVNEMTAEQIRRQKIDAIEGLKEITDALDDLEAWHAGLGRSFDDSDVREKPDVDINALKLKYPAAAAYLKAQSISYERNRTISKYGREALDAIIDNPNDYENIINNMDTKIRARCRNY